MRVLALIPEAVGAILGEYFNEKERYCHFPRN
jgi:hypothetical protein